MKPLERILVVNLNQLGAVLLALPVFRALKAAFPDAHIATLTGDSMLPLLENNPDCDEAIGWNKNWPWKRKLATLSRLRSSKFEAVVNLSQTRSRAFLSFFSGAPIRAGFDTSRAAGLHTIQVHEQEGHYHATRRNLDVARAIGAAPGDFPTGFRVFPSPAERDWAENFLIEAGIGPNDVLIGLNPGASSTLKQWDLAYMAELARLLSARPHKIALLGGPMDQDAGQRISELANVEMLHWTGRFNFRELAAILARVTVLVTADTGPMHLAVAMRTPTVIPNGPTDPEWTGPYTGRSIIIEKSHLPCIRCNLKACIHAIERECLKLITPDQVFNAVEELVARRHELVSEDERPVIRQQ